MTPENFWEVDMLPSTFVPLLFSHVAVGLPEIPIYQCVWGHLLCHYRGFHQIHGPLSPSPAGGHWGCFPVFAVRNSTAVHIA